MNSPDDLVAFLDESRKPVRSRKTGKADPKNLFYVTVAAVVFRADVDQCRSRLLRIEADLGFELNYNDLKSKTRRCAAIDAIADIAEWEGFIFEVPSPINATVEGERRARASQLAQAFPYLEKIGVRGAVLETRVRSSAINATLDERDRALVVKLRQAGKLEESFHTEHVGKSEPMVKLADLLASARTDYLCAKDESIFPRIAHRVTIFQV